MGKLSRLTWLNQKISTPELPKLNFFLPKIVIKNLWLYIKHDTNYTHAHTGISYENRIKLNYYSF